MKYVTIQNFFNYIPCQLLSEIRPVMRQKVLSKEMNQLRFGLVTTFGCQRVTRECTFSSLCLEK